MPPPPPPPPPLPLHQPLSSPTTTASTSTSTSHPETSSLSSPSTQSHSQSQSQSDAEKQATSAFTASLHSLGTNYTSALVDRAQNLHQNASALKAQEHQLQKTTEALGKLNNEFEGLAKDARKGLKEIGDVQNWAEIIERELLVVESVVGRLEEEDEEDRERERERRDGGGDLYGDSDMEREGEREGVRGSGEEVGNGDLNGVVKVGGEDGKGKGKDKGKGKETAQKKGWFGWW
ncbi:hypothetical protein BJY04DRAFT_10646 [Aspergillus karnatakaensis]|uniref:uncharacterized protein n=1 Tax=Aspergillus karnatakaensis TaxID=1810916 RepID=UPI003CCDC171